MLVQGLKEAWQQRQAELPPGESPTSIGLLGEATAPQQGIAPAEDSTSDNTSLQDLDTGILQLLGSRQPAAAADSEGGSQQRSLQRGSADSPQAGTQQGSQQPSSQMSSSQQLPSQQADSQASDSQGFSDVQDSQKAAYDRMQVMQCARQLPVANTSPMSLLHLTDRS